MSRNKNLVVIIKKVFKRLFLICILLAFVVGVCLLLITESYPSHLFEYLPNFNLLAKQFMIPTDQMSAIRFRNEQALMHLNSASTELASLTDQKMVLQKQVEDLQRRILSGSNKDLYSKIKLLEQEISAGEQESYFFTKLFFAIIAIILIIPFFYYPPSPPTGDIYGPDGVPEPHCFKRKR